MKKKVLQLNQSYEPMGLTTIRRATRLLWVGKALLVEPDPNGDKLISGGGREFDTPSVIRLKYYIDDITGKQRRSASKRHSIFVRDRFKCQYCGKRGGEFELTVDHILPRSRGGQNSPENLATACKPCNQRKGDRTPEEARMPLISNPVALVYGIDRQIMTWHAELRPEWRKYLFLEDAGEMIA